MNKQKVVSVKKAEISPVTTYLFNIRLENDLSEFTSVIDGGGDLTWSNDGSEIGPINR